MIRRHSTEDDTACDQGASEPWDGQIKNANELGLRYTPGKMVYGGGEGEQESLVRSGLLTSLCWISSRQMSLRKIP